MKDNPLIKQISEIHVWYPGFLKAFECSGNFLPYLPEILLLQQRFHNLIQNIKTSSSYTFTNLEAFKNECHKCLPEPDLLFIAGLYKILKDNNIDFVTIDCNAQSLYMGLLTALNTQNANYLTLYAYSLESASKKASLYYRLTCQIPNFSGDGTCTLEISNSLISLYNPITHERLTLSLKRDDTGLLEVLFKDPSTFFDSSLVEYIPGRNENNTFFSHLDKVRQLLRDSLKLRQSFNKEVLQKCQNVINPKDS